MTNPLLARIESAENPSREAVRILADDPVLLCKGALHHTYWPAQERIIRSMAQNRWTAIKGCNGSGKAYAIADGILWWIMRYDDGVAIVTGPTWEQIKRVMWGYLHRNVARRKTKHWKVNETEIRISQNNYALGLSTNQPESFSGWHGRVLICIDEAPGLEGFIWEAIEGIAAAGNVHVVAAGNPTIPGGPFYNAFTRGAANWNTISIDAFETPNFEGLYPRGIIGLKNEQLVQPLLSMSDDEIDANPFPQITKRRWVRDMWLAHGNDSVWQSRVRGNFPTQSANALYQLVYLEAAQRFAPDPGGPVIAGIDVAGPGTDETALTLRCGDTVILQKAWGDADARGPLVAELQRYDQRLQAIHVDSAGMGYYFYQHLCDVFGKYRVAAVNVGEATVDPVRYVNLKAEVYWAFRERLQLGGVLNWQDREAFGQATNVRYSEDGRGRIVIESKEATKKRGNASPDRLESIILAFMTPRPAESQSGPKVGGARGMHRGTAW